MAEYTFHICNKGQHSHFIIGEKLEPMEGGETAVIINEKRELVGIVRLSDGISIVRAEMIQTRGYLDVVSSILEDAIIIRDDDGMGLAVGKKLLPLRGKYILLTVEELPAPKGDIPVTWT